MEAFLSQTKTGTATYWLHLFWNTCKFWSWCNLKKYINKTIEICWLYTEIITCRHYPQLCRFLIKSNWYRGKQNTSQQEKKIRTALMIMIVLYYLA